MRILCDSIAVIVCCLALLMLGTAAHADWSDWWRTPTQKAQAALEAGEFETLKSIAPDAAWQGTAEHKSGEFDAAAKTFSDSATQLQVDGEDAKANRARYNQGVSQVRSGDYEKAVQSFDEVLEQDPQFEDARHNRDIAQQLIQQQEQQQSQDGEGEESSEDGEQQESDSQGEQSDDQQDSEQSESEQSESQDQSSDQSTDSDAQPEDDEMSEAESKDEQEREEQAAREALEAEAREQAEEEQADDEDAQNAGAQQNEQPISESEQATEQWLRRIPDDPAGLLRRKLEQSHRTDYPEVRDAREPW